MFPEPEPAPPSFGKVRLATLADLPRIASVASAGFFWSPSFQFQRPYHANYPDDTLSSYYHEYHASIIDPNTVVLVAEDELEPNENEQVYEALRKSPLHVPGDNPLARVIVGICSITLKPGSSFVGQFQPNQTAHMEPLGVCTYIGKLHRDQSAEAVKLYGEATAPAKNRHLAGKMRLSTLAVHPAYWRRGIATCLVSWCTRLADIEGAAVGVSATPMGATVAAHAGFEEQEIVRLERSNSSTASGVGDVELWIGIRPASRSPSATSTVCSDSSTPDF